VKGPPEATRPEFKEVEVFVVGDLLQDGLHELI
jgi:hypothetical protein